MSTRLHLFKSKIHRATITHADLDYEGSVTISGELMAAADIHEHEQVHVWNVTRGTRLVTYALRGEDSFGASAYDPVSARRPRGSRPSCWWTNTTASWTRATARPPGPSGDPPPRSR